MRLYTITFGLLGLIWFSTNPQAYAVDLIAPVIIANGSQDNLTIQTTTPLNININTGQPVDKKADWWVIAYGATLGWYSWVYPNGWVKGIVNTSHALNFDNFPLNVFNGYLPSDQYTFYFGVDMTPDNIINEPLVYSYVNVDVNSATPSVYGISMGCTNYFSALNTPSWFNSYGGQSTKQEVSITERDGTLIKKLSFNLGGIDLGANRYYPQNIEKDIKNNLNKYLTFTCTYQGRNGKSQFFQYRHPIADTKIWERNDDISTTTFFEISMLSDMQMRLWMLLMKNGYSESEAWSESHAIVAKAFPDVKYGDLQDEPLINCCSMTFSQARDNLAAENTPNGRAFRKLKLIAEDFTSEPTGDVQALINYSTNDYVQGKVKSLSFSNQAVTGAVFTQLTSIISYDSENFGAASWLNYRSTDNAFASISRVNLDGSWEGSLEWQSGASNSEYSVQKYQAISLPTVNYDKVFLDFSLIRAVGGCKSGLFACTIASGIAGIFICFENNSGITLGCTLWTAVSDLITIPNHLGNVFDAMAPFGLYDIDIISITPSSPNSDAFGLDRTIALSKLLESSSNSTLQSAAASGEVTRIEFGAAVLASNNSCWKCRAEISVHRLGILSLP